MDTLATARKLMSMGLGSYQVRFLGSTIIENRLHSPLYILLALEAVGILTHTITFDGDHLWDLVTPCPHRQPADRFGPAVQDHLRDLEKVTEMLESINDEIRLASEALDSLKSLRAGLVAQLNGEF